MMARTLAPSIAPKVNFVSKQADTALMWGIIFQSVR